MMTEAELWHMQLLAVENTATSLEGLATIIFAYLAAAYVVGAKLSRFQAALATVFFVVVASLFSLYTFIEYRRSIYFMKGLTENYGVNSLVPNDVIMPVFAFVLVSLIPACVYFLYHVRRNAGAVDTADPAPAEAKKPGNAQ